MAIQLLTGPAGSGKTTEAVSLFKGFLRRGKFDVARYLVPTLDQAQKIRKLILDDPQIPGLFDRTVGIFFDFSEEIAQRAHLGSKGISELQKNLLLEVIVADADCSYFAAAKRFPGFIEELGEIIGELKMAMINPDDLMRIVEAASDQEEEFRQKGRELAQFYRAYHDQVLVRHGLHDGEGIMWDALEQLKQNPGLLGNIECLVLDGFWKFTLIQRELISFLTDHLDLIITLDYQPDRELLFQRSARTREWLLGLPGAQEETVARSSRAATGLSHLQAHLFSTGAPQIEGDDSVTFLEGSSPAVEVEMIAQTIKRLMREEGYRPSDFVIWGVHKEK